MKLIDHLIGAVLIAIVAAYVVQVVVTPLVTIAAVLTICFVVIQVTRHLTTRW
jgi:hypothetical protein